jgi:acetolactate synthase-1/2/3 large subunit
MAKLHVLGDIKSIFNRTLNYLSETTFDEISVAQKKLEERIAKPADQKTRYFRLRDNEAYNDDSIPIKPQRLMKVIPRMFPYNTHYLSDIGNSMAWAIGYLHPYKSSQQRENRFSEKGIRSGVFRTCLEFGSMGWAIGASIGTAFACPGDPVVVFCGDGAFLMSGQEITVALEHHLNVVFIILNDSSLGMVKHGQKLSGAEEIGSSLPKVNFAKMARSMGITAYTIRSTQDLLELPRETIINSNAPALLDVHIDPNEVPPIDLRTNAIKQKEV